jgi:acyl-CoA synthetase (AMP-forming)/AMP-acid ligase II
MISFDAALAAGVTSFSFSSTATAPPFALFLPAGRPAAQARPLDARKSNSRRLELCSGSRIDETDTVINGFPLFHVGGTMTAGLSILAAGGHVVVPSAQSLRSPKVIQNYWGIVERYRATIVSGVPTSIAALAEVPVAETSRRCAWRSPAARSCRRLSASAFRNGPVLGCLKRMA